MTKHKAAQLQKAWASKGCPPCTHHVLKLVRTNNRTYLTGEYACPVCGAVIAKEVRKPATHEQADGSSVTDQKGLS